MGRRIRRVFLVVLAVSVGLAMLLGIATVLTGEGSTRTEQAMQSALLLGGSSLAAFLAMLPLERRRWRPVAWAALASTALCFVVCLFLIWFWDLLADTLAAGAPNETWRVSEALSKTVVTTIALAACLTTAAVLLLPRLKTAGTYVQFATVGCALFVCASGLLMMWGRVEEEAVWRLWSALLILTLGGVVGTPILARFMGMKTEAELKEVTATVQMICPRCQLMQTLPIGEGRCARCKLRFKIEVEEPKCPRCGYNLYLLTRPRCPECGLLLRKEDVSENYAQLMAWAKANDTLKEGGAASVDDSERAKGPPAS